MNNKIGLTVGVLGLSLTGFYIFYILSQLKKQTNKKDSEKLVKEIQEERSDVDMIEII